MGARMRAHDWASTFLGPADRWPQAFVTLLRVMLSSRQPMFLCWGPERTLVYNDAYAPMLGARHPDALGRPFFDVWPEVRIEVGVLMDRVYAGDPVHMDDLHLTLHRNGYPEETHFSFSYTPVPDDRNTVAGLFCACTEITKQVLAERRLSAERERFASLFEQTPTFMTVLRGREHRFELANPRYLKLVGHRDVVGRTVAEALPDAVEQGFLEILDQVYDSGVPQTFHGIRYAVQAVPGGPHDERFVDVVYQPIRDVDGTVGGIFIEGADVTDRARAETRREALVRITDRFNELTRADDIAFAASQVLGETLAVSRVGYGTIDPDAETLHVERDWNAPGVETLAGVVPLRTYGSFIDSLKRGEFVSIADVERDDRTAGAAEASKGRGAHAFVNVPVLEQGRLVAVLFVNHAEVRDWAPDDLAFIREVAGRTRIAVERSRVETALRDLNADLERQVAERSRELSRTWQVSTDLLGIADDAGFFVRTNPAWKSLLGWSDAEAARIPFVELVHPDDVRATHAALDRLRAGEAVLRFENRCRTTAGGYRWLAWVAVPEGGQFYCSARDVTEEREHAATLAERTAERDRLWNLSEDMLARANYQGTMSAVSPAWTQVLGWSEAELLSRPYATFMHPDDTDQTLAALVRMGDTKRPTRFENRIAASDGSWKPIEWTVAPEPDGLHFIAVGRDLSVAKAREAELAAAQEALRQSQKMEAVGQLTGGLAHDFNNLLAGISGSLELMQTRMQQGRLSDVDRYMAAAQGASKRAAALTHRLLAFSRRQTLAPKPTDVNRLVSGMQELVQRTVGPAIPVEVVGASGLWPALVDPPQLENALLNLCINARDAMPDGGRITVETANKWLDERAARQHDMPEGQYLSLCVTDTGTGMPPDVVTRVFEPFFTTKPLGEGTGLGLSMIYGFAQQSGGQVRIYSEVGRGTTVCVYLPRHYGEIAEDTGDEVAATLPRSEQGETVLVVDDEPTVRMLVNDILEDLGYTAIEAADSAAGLKVLQSDVRIDLLVTDVGLPGGMNGRQMADAGRVTRPDLKVLFITGYAENSILGNGHLAPGMAVLTKPFAVDTMSARIRSMIEASDAGPLGRRLVP
ncbi:PAS domain-containing protein [Methylobacterium dankookense]|uniref:histidine kinase n=2 Tax=Methylobacteriaceae TaxID=119045 RepID=A0A564G0H7_9HYPH|nr:PAS domain-containing protein [Methylobacterium dankookense]GJD55124.1 Sensor histidine kinase RcsC [Methylobacterium dankookense]VUF13737.1 Blue-light-activated protein [Methylobacterium dankookense]